MSVKIRLRRVGAKKQPSYRVVVADSRSPRDGRFIEIIGFYNPRTKPTTITIDADKARKWIGNGAQPTESVASLLYRAGIVDMRSDRYRKSGDAAIARAEAADAEANATMADLPAATATVEAPAITETPVAESAATSEPVAVAETLPVAETTMTDAPADSAPPTVLDAPSDVVAPTDVAEPAVIETPGV